eukprot:TRINITY_DN5924_c0_g2_i1.p4 TRINITY_DN5924_c0_g2~~TRINITY_DN5924_c0_g2_i1.p4  ORF type:complete len:101 (-),score=3.95 TRINITY_DN5924_c0_g2_i1:294-596(-)
MIAMMTMSHHGRLSLGLTLCLTGSEIRRDVDGKGIGGAKMPPEESVGRARVLSVGFMDVVVGLAYGSSTHAQTQSLSAHIPPEQFDAQRQKNGAPFGPSI